MMVYFDCSNVLEASGFEAHGLAACTRANFEYV
jgi:hypothetical protein